MPKDKYENCPNCSKPIPDFVKGQSYKCKECWFDIGSYVKEIETEEYDAFVKMQQN